MRFQGGVAMLLNRAPLEIDSIVFRILKNSFLEPFSFPLWVCSWLKHNEIEEWVVVVGGKPIYAEPPVSE